MLDQRRQSHQFTVIKLQNMTISAAQKLKSLHLHAVATILFFLYLISGVLLIFLDLILLIPLVWLPQWNLYGHLLLLCMFFYTFKSSCVAATLKCPHCGINWSNTFFRLFTRNCSESGYGLWHFQVSGFESGVRLDHSNITEDAACI